MIKLPGIKQRHLLRHLLWLWLLTTTIMGGCSSHTTHRAYHSFAHEEWKMQDTISLNVTPTDSLADYTLDIEIRNSNNYPYEDLPISIICTEGDSLLLLNDTLLLNLADEYGRWKGKGIGGLYQTEYHAGKLHIMHAGRHCIRISHLLPDTLLKGISDIGIRIGKISAYHDQHPRAGR